jgi:hypothetical protein
MASKFFDSELKRLAGLKEFSSPVSSKEESATLSITETDTGNTPYSYEAKFTPKATSTRTQIESTKQSIKTTLALQLMEKFKSNLQKKTSVNLKELAAVIAGAESIGNKRTYQHTMDYSTGAPVDESTLEGGQHLVEVKSGKYRRIGTLRPLLEELFKLYVVKDMTRRGAPLKFQTGRFANSAEITSFKASTRNSKTPYLSLAYTYMVAPYSVFDPAQSNYRGLSSVGRNPQRILGQALRKAATDLISSRYKITIVEGQGNE